MSDTTEHGPRPKTDARRPLGTWSTVGTWLEDEVGAPLIRQVLTGAGMAPEALPLLRNIPVGRLLQGKEAMIDDLASSANVGRSGRAPRPGALRWTPGRFAGKTAIVTGAASGIGRATATRIALEGGRVVAVDLSADGLDGLVQELDGHDVVPLAADITSQDDVDRVVAAADGRVDALGNVAGLSDDFTAVHELRDEMLERVFEVNVFGPIRLMRAVVPLMMAARRGSVVNVASEAALRGSSSGAAYTASKHAVVGLTRSSAFMYEPFGIRVNSVAPGGTLTGMRPPQVDGWGPERVRSHSADVPVALPEQLAASISFLLSDDAGNVTGAVLPSDGGESVF